MPLPELMVKPEKMNEIAVKCFSFKHLNTMISPRNVNCRHNLFVPGG